MNHTHITITRNGDSKYAVPTNPFDRKEQEEKWIDFGIYIAENIGTDHYPYIGNKEPGDYPKELFDSIEEYQMSDDSWETINYNKTKKLAKLYDCDIRIALTDKEPVTNTDNAPLEETFEQAMDRAYSKSNLKNIGEAFAFKKGVEACDEWHNKQQRNTIAIDKVVEVLQGQKFNPASTAHDRGYNQAIQDAIKAIQSLNH